MSSPSKYLLVKPSPSGAGAFFAIHVALAVQDGSCIFISFLSLICFPFFPISQGQNLLSWRLLPDKFNGSPSSPKFSSLLHSVRNKVFDSRPINEE